MEEMERKHRCIIIYYDICKTSCVFSLIKWRFCNYRYRFYFNVTWFSIETNYWLATNYCQLVTILWNSLENNIIILLLYNSG